MRGRKSGRGRKSTKKGGMGKGMMYGEEFFSEIGGRGRRKSRR